MNKPTDTPLTDALAATHPETSEVYRMAECYSEMLEHARHMERRAEFAERLIHEHNNGCDSACDGRKDCEPFTGRGRLCPECPRDWRIV